MARKGPFLTTATYYNGLSRTEFRRLPKAAKREAMLEWFGENYEDPVHNTPYESAEGGYQYIWGGPYDAPDVIGDMFGGLVPDQMLEEIVEELQSDGTFEWAPIQKAEDFAENEDEDELQLSSLDHLPDDPGPRYGTAEDYDARNRATRALDQLSSALTAHRDVGIGHNRPPDDTDEEVATLGPAVEELRAELAKPNPTISFVKRLAFPLRNALVAATKWTGRKVDIAVDEAMKSIGKTAGPAALATFVGWQYHGQLSDAFSAVMHWLHIVTLHF